MLYNYQDVCKERMSIRLEDGRVVDGMFADGYRLDPDTLPEGHFWYQTRHGDDDWCDPLTIRQGRIVVNFCGTFVCDVDLELDDEHEIEVIERSYIE